MADAQVVLSKSATVLVGPQEPAPVVRAAEDLVRDLEKVFGPGPRLVRNAYETSGVTLWVTLRQNQIAGIAVPKTAESFVIASAPKPAEAGKGTAIVLAGSDVRGTIYAIYQFSQKYLGVDPLYFWTDHEPPRRSRISLPRSLHESEGPPAFRYRGWFINDEDLLTGWTPGGADRTGIALKTWDRVFEALLRLRGNMIVPGTFLFPDEPQIRAASARGLVIAQHHIEVLGTNTYRWPDEQPYSFVRFPELLRGAWTKAMEAYLPDQEIIWTIGYRGRHDRAFWEDDHYAGASERDKGKVIEQAMAAQMQIVRKERAHPVFVMNAWDEAVGLLRSGALHVPQGVTLVWPDDGHGNIRDNGEIRAGQGVYYHTAMHDFMANQLTEMVPPERLEHELERAAGAGATAYLLDNTSDLRPVPMTTRAVMEIAWRGSLAGKGASRSRQYLERWSLEEFGPKAADKVADYYAEYFAAPARYGEAGDKIMGDNAYHTLARYLLVNLIRGETQIPAQFRYEGSFERFAQALSEETREAAPRWQRARASAENAARDVPREREPFFRYHVLSQLDIQEHSNGMLSEVAAAWLANGEQRQAHLKMALGEVQLVLRAFEAGEYGKWKGFYRMELFTNVRLTRALIEAALDRMQGKPAPPDVPVQARTPDPYPVLKAYQGHRRVAM